MQHRNAPRSDSRTAVAVTCAVKTQVTAHDVILSPLEGAPYLVVLAAQTVEMQLIEDHTRQQDAPTVRRLTRRRTANG